MNRNNSVGDVSELLDRVHPWVQMYITDIGWQKIHTYASRLQNTNIAELVINWLQDKIQVCTIDQTILQQARFSPLQDFESAVELVCATDEKLDAIVTHNYDDFAQVRNKFWIWSVAELWMRANLESQIGTTRSIL